MCTRSKFENSEFTLSEGNIQNLISRFFSYQNTKSELSNDMLIIYEIVSIDAVTVEFKRSNEKKFFFQIY